MKYPLPKDEGSFFQNSVTDEIQLESWKDRIFSMTQVQLASLYHFSPKNHVVFTNSELYGYFWEKFNEKGGMTPEVRQIIG